MKNKQNYYKIKYRIQNKIKYKINNKLNLHNNKLNLNNNKLNLNKNKFNKYLFRILLRNQI